MIQRDSLGDFISVTVSVALLGLGLGTTMPLTALALASKGYGADVVGWITAATAFGGVVGTFLTPAASQRLGRRFAMIACLAFSAISLIPLQYTNSLPIWFVMRMLFGAAMAPMFVLGESWINTLSTDSVRSRVVAIYATTFTAFQVLGPMLTDWLSRLQNSSFLICGCLFLLGAPGIFIARESRSTGVASESSPSAETSTEKYHHSTWVEIVRIAPSIIAGTAFFAAFDNVVLSFLPLTAMDWGFTQTSALAATSTVPIGDAALQFPIGWLADRFERRRVQLLCGVVVCLMLPLLPLAMHSLLVWPLFLFVLGGVGGALYTLSMAASGEYFSGAALERSAGLIGLAWSFGSSAGAAATGEVMHRFGPSAMPLVLWLFAFAFVVVSFNSRHPPMGAKG